MTRDGFPSGHFTFANGWTVSIQSSEGHYCGPDTAEIAAWDADGRWLDFGTDTVKGYQTADEVAAFSAKIAALPSGTRADLLSIGIALATS